MTDPGNRAGADEPRSPWLRNGFVMAAAFLGFVTVVGGAVVLTSDGSGADGGSGKDGAPAAARPSSAPPRAGDPSPPPPDGDGPCPELADDERDVPDSAPRHVKWDLYEGVALPSSKAAGPAVADADIARCYARTPVGALLAASQISVRYLAADDWRQVTRVQTVGAGRDAYIAQRTAAEKKGSGVPERGAHGQIAGFKFVTYSSSTAVLQTVWRFSDGRMQAATTTMLWRDGDWRLEYPADPADPAPVDSLAGYTEWGGV
ncbi:hypothetical protein GCM10009801_12490 [Streptomyces albiaxialis]|uniref:DUF8175 domain-containing protein n=1 Tax=Streptomyces albiaxialis TaxID=329523 RepID=A0ABN2VMK4_9ACTN